MKVSSERIEESQVVLNIEFEPEAIERSMDKAYRRLVVKTNIPGFRKGKAPRAMLERYIGRTALLEEALDIIFPDAYEEALKQENIDAIGHPKVELTQLEPVTLKAIVPIRPTVTLGKYQDIRVTPETPQVTEEEVDAVIEQARNSSATWEPVERPVQFDDRVTLDIESVVDDSPPNSNQGIDYTVTEGNPVPVPGFAEQIVGMSKGEEKEVDIAFPEDYEQTELSGREFHFKVKVNEIKEKKLPELDDEFAKGINEEFETLEQLRNRVRENLQHQAEHDARDRLEENAVSALISDSQIEFPPQLVEHEVEHMLEDQTEQLRGRGITLEQYLRLINKTKDDLKEELSQRARDRITRTLALDKLAGDEEIKATPEEIDAEIDAMAAGNEDPEKMKEVYNTPSVRLSLERAIERQKTINRLLEIATEGAVKGNPVTLENTFEELDKDSVATNEIARENANEAKVEEPAE